MKTVWTTGPKCECGYGLNQAVPLIEQADIDTAVAEFEAELGRPVTPFERASIAIPIKKQGAWGVTEADIRRDHLRQATMVLAMHVNEDGSCPGRVGEVPGADKQNEVNARAKTFQQRLDLAEKVALRHGGKINPNAGTETMAVAEIQAEKTKEALRI